MLPIPSDTRRALGLPENCESAGGASACESRSLLADRYANPQLKEDDRRDFFTSVAKRAAHVEKIRSWRNFLSCDLATSAGRVLYAQTQSRLMLNMAGGVMENAGLCLDRFGLPYIPGSAVKGCARRMAIQELLEIEELEKKAEKLAEIAVVFGWGETDWRTRQEVLRGVHQRANESDAQLKERQDAIWKERRSDFAYAVGDVLWDAVRSNCGKSLIGRDALDSKTFGQFGGAVAFLPAHPVKTGVPCEPELGTLELDVVTVHHKEYYSEPVEPKDVPQSHSRWQKWKKEHAEWERKWGDAPDTEEPVPIVFPAVVPGHVFMFALLPLRSYSQRLKDASPRLLKKAHEWLASGLETFGLGAKTNAGYGWFADVTKAVRAAEEDIQKEKTERDRQAKEKVDRDAARASLQPDAELIAKLRAMKEPDLRGQINPFATEERFWTQKDERLQLTILYFLLITAPDLLPADRANPKSKIAKAIVNLSGKFGHISPKTV